MLAALAVLVACTSPPSGPPTPTQAAGYDPGPRLARAATAVAVPDGLSAAPFDRPRELNAPNPGGRCSSGPVAGCAARGVDPDGRLLVSRPANGDVVALTPGAGQPAQTTVVTGLTQPHGLAFAGDTLYVAESNQVDAYPYRDGGVGERRVVVSGLPDAKSPELRGAYAHALKSVTVGPDGALYVSVGSTGNVSPQDRDASPQRAAILRVPSGGGAPEVYARGVRNGTGLAVDPDGAVWTAVNNRDNIAYPDDGDYDGDGAGDRTEVLTGYVNDHPLELLARLTPGRDLGWPYCNPDPDVEPGAAGPRSATPTARSCATSRPTRTAPRWTAPRCRRSSRGWARTPRRSG